MAYKFKFQKYLSNHSNLGQSVNLVDFRPQSLRSSLTRNEYLEVRENNIANKEKLKSLKKLGNNQEIRYARYRQRDKRLLKDISPRYQMLVLNLHSVICG